MDRFKFRGVLKLDTQNIVIYSSFLENYDDELVLSVTEGYFKEQVYKAGYKLTKEDWKIEKHQNYNLENIEKYYKYLLQSKREKDILRIPIVEKYMKNSVKGFDD